jgi:SAM-dependent methyltransferase
VTTVDPHGFPPGFFDRADPSDDAGFYSFTRLVTHIDDHAIAELGTFYARMGVTGDVCDLMSSWVSHLPERPRSLTVLGMNAAELDANPMADSVVVHDLNADPSLPFEDDAFDDVLCAVSVDYLTRPVEVIADAARTLRRGGRFLASFSNRCFPTKAIRGWLHLDDAGRCALVARYLEASGGFEPATIETLVSPGLGVDPLYAVWATRR